MQHRSCVVDALARAGRLDEAERFAETEGCMLDPVILRTLLGACRTHRDVTRAERIAEALIIQDPHDATPYVLLANTYRLCNRLRDADAVVARRKEANARTVVGRTVTFVDGESVSFGAGDFSHPLGRELREKCREIAQRIGGAGHVTDDSWSTRGSTPQQRADALCVHSERIAIAYCLLKTPPGTPIRLVNNLRVCGDCHEAIKRFARIWRL